ncbi:MAG: hypothetical protein KDC46_03655 [Thermoleophilia bacterium]|nr:hypothetical protein [Thermoleophilia bacterium]
MSESGSHKQSSADQPVERPQWRFSGRRGTPVHLREQAPATLPREIQQAIVQMARERSGEVAAAAATEQQQATTTQQRANRPKMYLGVAAESRGDGQSPPVAGAPMPVERRTNRRDSDTPGASPTIIGTAEVPTPPVVVEPEITTEPEAGTVPEVAPEVEVAPKPETVETEVPAAANEDAAANQSTKAKATSKRRRAKIRAAKARAKAKAKAARSGQSVPDAAASDEHQILAGDREVVATDEPIAIEPSPAPVVEHEPVVESEPVAEPEPVVEPVAVEPVSVEPVVLSPAPEPAPEPSPLIALLSEPSGGREAALQASWELGRLPILLEQTMPPEIAIPAAAAEPIAQDDPEPAPEPIAQGDPEPAPEPVAVEVTAPAPAAEAPSRGWQPLRTRAVPDTPLEPIELRPIGWQPIPTNTEPAPLPTTPDRPEQFPAAIEQLDAGLDPRATSQSYDLARAREVEVGRAPAARAADARHRVGRRRKELDQVVGQLAQLAGSRSDR